MYFVQIHHFNVPQQYFIRICYDFLYQVNFEIFQLNRSWWKWYAWRSVQGKFEVIVTSLIHNFFLIWWHLFSRFQDKLAISLVDSRTHTIQLTAQGSGTTIVAEPQFGPVFDIGPQFSNNVYEKHFRFYNRGRRLQQIYWMTEGFAVKKIKRKQDYNTADMKYKVCMK